MGSFGALRLEVGRRGVLSLLVCGCDIARRLFLALLLAAVELLERLLTGLLVLTSNDKTGNLKRENLRSLYLCSDWLTHFSKIRLSHGDIRDVHEQKRQNPSLFLYLNWLFFYNSENSVTSPRLGFKCFNFPIFPHASLVIDKFGLVHGAPYHDLRQRDFDAVIVHNDAETFRSKSKKRLWT